MHSRDRQGSKLELFEVGRQVQTGGGNLLDFLGGPTWGYFAQDHAAGADLNHGHVGYDDEGVKTKEWDLIKESILVNYQAIRDQAHIIGEKESHGCCYADSWSSIQFQRMPNVSLRPGKKKPSPADLNKDVEKGVYIIGNG